MQKGCFLEVFFFISVVVSGRSGNFAFACESVILHPDFLDVHVFFPRFFPCRPLLLVDFSLRAVRARWTLFLRPSLDFVSLVPSVSLCPAL
jgi:hypothetical protein